MGVQVPEIFISDEKAINNEPLLVAEVAVDAKQLARDPQLEHGKGENSIALIEFMRLECICCGSAYRLRRCIFFPGKT